MAEAALIEKEVLDLTEEEEATYLVANEDEAEEKPSDLLPAKELKEEDNYVPRFEIRERTFGLANPKIIPLNKDNLGKIMIGLFSLKEIRELEKQKRESR